MRIDRGDGADNADGRPDDTDAPEAQAADRAGPEPGDESAPEVGAIPAERTIAYRDKAEAVYRAYTIDQGCAEVEKIETDTVTPAMLRIEAEDSTRRLVGFENPDSRVAATMHTFTGRFLDCIPTAQRTPGGASASVSRRDRCDGC